MKLLATIWPKDVDSAVPSFDYDNFTSRLAVRAVVFDGRRVALLYVGKHDYYMLPGGGVDEGEDLPIALIREAREELGCEVSVKDEVGSVLMYNDRWKKRQTDFCYIAQLVKKGGNTSRTAIELEEGHESIWVEDLSSAIRLMQEAVPRNREGKLVKERELQFLRATKKLIAHPE